MKAVMTFGRFQPPTKAHGDLFKLMRTLGEDSGGYDLVYLSPTVDTKRNPLTYEARLRLLRMMFPVMNFIDDPRIKHPFDAVCNMGRRGFEDIIIVAGDDRISKYKDFVNYIDHPNPEKRIHFVKTISFVSLGTRDPDAEDITGVSATKARELARIGDYEGFKAMVPSTFKEEITEQLYMDVRRGLHVSDLQTHQ
jgi:hypothetical protein